MKEYLVGVTMYNTFTVKADSEDEAKSIVREMGVEEVLVEVDFNISYVDEGEQV